MATVTVLGLGNVLMTDESIGVRLMERVRDSRAWSGEVEFIDGGAGGLNLLNVIEESQRLVVFDAAELGGAPGDFVSLTPDQFAPGSPAGRLSLHDISFLETLELSGRFFRKPDVVQILAIQPKTVAFGRQLSGDLQNAMERLMRAGAELIERTLAER